MHCPRIPGRWRERQKPMRDLLTDGWKLYFKKLGSKENGTCCNVLGLNCKQTDASRCLPGSKREDEEWLGTGRAVHKELEVCHTHHWHNSMKVEQGHCDNLEYPISSSKGVNGIKAKSCKYNPSPNKISYFLCSDTSCMIDLSTLNKVIFMKSKKYSSEDYLNSISFKETNGTMHTEGTFI